MILSRTEQQPLVWVVIPTWNRRKDLLACLESVITQSYQRQRVLIVDNGSTDGTRADVERQFPTLLYHPLESNCGATYASNVGFNIALEGGADYVLRLDSDVILGADYVQNLIQAALDHPDAGILTGKVFYFDDPKRIWSVGAYKKSWDLGAIEVGRGKLDDPTQNYVREIDYAWSTGMLISSHTLRLTGGFDTDFFVYFEEADLCIRASSNGLRILSVPTAEMWHKLGQSVQSAWVARQWGRSKAIFYRKHSRGARRLILIAYAYLYAVWRALRPKAGAGNRGPLPAALFGITTGLFHGSASLRDAGALAEK